MLATLTKHKYWELTKRAFIKGITYRAQLALWFVIDFIPLGVLILVWISAFQGQASIRDYTIVSIGQYYFLAMIINAVTGNHFEQERVQEVRDGKIDYFMIRPLSYLAEIGFRALGVKILYILITFAISAVIALGTILVFNISLQIPSLLQLSQFSLLLVAGYSIDFLIALLIVLLGFWFEHADGLEHFKWIVVTLFSGFIVPIAFMPEWMARTTELLPFKYISAVPIGIIQNTRTLSIFDLIYVFSFIAFLILLVKLLWGKAIYKYSSAGG
jgi:ABC-2 type transport system permease protein